MILTVAPPPLARDSVPPMLFSHVLVAPTGIPNPGKNKAGAIRLPLAYKRARLALKQTGLDWPGFMAADASLWLNTVVKHVTWDLGRVGGGAVLVKLSDGSTVEWELQGRDGDTPPPSAPSSGKHSVESDEDELQDLPTFIPPRQAVKPHSAFSRTTQPAARFRRLDELLDEIRIAWDELVSPRDGSRSCINPLDPAPDYKALLLLAANPSAELPRRWQQDVGTLRESGALVAPLGDTQGADDFDQSDDLVDYFRYALADNGVNEQLQVQAPAIDHSRPVLRPTTPGSVAQQPASSTPTTSQTLITGSTLDRISPAVRKLVTLLRETRHLLLDLFALTVIPKLKERLPPTYSLWAAESAVVWCHRSAILAGKELAEIILQLLDDDEGDLCRTTDDDEETSSEDGLSESDNEVDDDSGDEGRADRTAHQSRRRAEREERRRRNILASMRDDYALRRWCEKAYHRVRVLDDKEEGTKVWLPDIPSWDIRKPYPAIQATSTTIRLKRSRSGIHVRAAAVDGAETTDPDTERSTSAPISPLFIIPDPLGLEILPGRLPRVVCNDSFSPPLPRGMAMMQKYMKDALNSLSGIQKKMVELDRFVQQQRAEWEADMAEQRKLGDVALKSSAETAFTPLARQPLRFSTADKQMASQIVQAPEYTRAKKSSAPQEDQSLIIASPSPAKRKKQVNNVEAMARVEKAREETRNNSAGDIQVMEEGDAGVLAAAMILSSDKKRPPENSATGSVTKKRKVFLESLGPGSSSPASEEPQKKNQKKAVKVKVKPKQLDSKKRKNAPQIIATPPVPSSSAVTPLAIHTPAIPSPLRSKVITFKYAAAAPLARSPVLPSLGYLGLTSAVKHLAPPLASTSTPIYRTPSLIMTSHPRVVHPNVSHENPPTLLITQPPPAHSHRVPTITRDWQDMCPGNESDELSEVEDLLLARESTCREGAGSSSETDCRDSAAAHHGDIDVHTRDDGFSDDGFFDGRVDEKRDGSEANPSGRPSGPSSDYYQQSLETNSESSVVSSSRLGDLLPAWLQTSPTPSASAAGALGPVAAASLSISPAAPPVAAVISTHQSNPPTLSSGSRRLSFYATAAPHLSFPQPRPNSDLPLSLSSSMELGYTWGTGGEAGTGSDLTHSTGAALGVVGTSATAGDTTKLHGQVGSVRSRQNWE